MNNTEDFIQKDREEAACCADAMIEMVNADHHDLISFNRDIGCRIRDHIERLRREVTQQAATISTLRDALHTIRQLPYRSAATDLADSALAASGEGIYDL